MTAPPRDERWIETPDRARQMPPVLPEGERGVNLTEFLLVRIAEDEEVAREAGSGPWQWEQGYGEMCNDPECSFGSLMQVKEDGSLYQLMDVHGYDVHQPWEGAEHIARWDPARVLAECGAKRRIVERAEVWADHLDDVLRLLAAPYADHPDYRSEWTP